MKNKVGFPARKPDLIPVTRDVYIEEAEFSESDIRRSSRKTYDKAIEQVQAIGLELPCTAKELVDFLKYNMDKFGSSTLAVRLAAISRWHKKRKLPNPVKHPDVAMARKSFINLKEEAGEKPRQVTPLLADLIRDINIICLEEYTLEAHRDRAVILLMYVGCLRSEEVVSLRVHDLMFTRNGVVLHLWATKNGTKKRLIPYNKKNSALCAVDALLMWLRKANISDPNEWVIRGLYKGGNTLRDNKMTTKSIRTIIKKRVAQVGEKNWEGYAGHSGRRGFVTDGINSGAKLFDIKNGGGWLTYASVERYFDENDGEAASVIIDHLNKDA